MSSVFQSVKFLVGFFISIPYDVSTKISVLDELYSLILAVSVDKVFHSVTVMKSHSQMKFFQNIIEVKMHLLYILLERRCCLSMVI